MEHRKFKRRLSELVDDLTAAQVRKLIDALSASEVLLICPSTACRVFQRVQARQRQLGSASVHRNPRREGYSPDGERRNAMHVTPSQKASETQRA